MCCKVEKKMNWIKKNVALLKDKLYGTYQTLKTNGNHLYYEDLYQSVSKNIYLNDKAISEHTNWLLYIL